MKLCLSPVGKVYRVCALLQNDHTCLYGNQVSAFFGMELTSLQEYFSWTIVAIVALLLHLIETL